MFSYQGPAEKERHNKVKPVFEMRKWGKII
jgi:hypothetical protein